MPVKKLFFYTSVRKGVIGKRIQSRINAFIEQLNGRSIYVEIGPVYGGRSNNQNRYYWGVIVRVLKAAILEAWGDDLSSDEVHDILKKECNYIERVNVSTGEILKIPRSTTNQSTVEAEDYYERCRRWIYEWFNLVVPLPNEDYIAPS